MIKNSKVYETYLDRLYTGCSIGSYAILTGDDYSFSAKAKSDSILLKITESRLEEFRERFDELNFKISEYENYIDREGLPYCDYKLYRAGIHSMSPIKKFQLGIRRIIRIVVS